MIYDVIAGYLLEQIDLLTYLRIYLNTLFGIRFTNPDGIRCDELGDEGGSSFINYGPLPSLAVVRNVEESQDSENGPQHLLQISRFLREKLVSLSNRFDESLLFGCTMQKMDRNHASAVKVLQVVNGVGDIVGPVHQLRFQDATVPMMVAPRPLELIFVSVIDTPLLAPASGLASGPRVLEDGVEGGPGQVEARIIAAVRVIVRMDCEPGNNTKRLRISLEAIPVMLIDCVSDYLFAVVTERRMPQIVGESRRLYNIRIQAAPGIYQLGRAVRP